ncbi:SOS response-associated peptidase [Halostagnicola sp. A-GB9-2]|uniref:SOS response-associated peptidase n=1 Tax=Halostagnicola sp. A-GB9-2 TaxID=3048066 RepID=UPI0024BF47D5|nr:SOS response-associated peptidase [Halostagnicola sp. A-GB9-2]MDJ1432365.1 SOS response-associated peptidase [Halostagnicola sp. A-GB9-2]
MCGRYTLFVDQDDLEDRFDARFSEPFGPRYNMAPGQRLPVITNEEPESIRSLEWGLVPSWADDDRDGLINARAETLDEKPSFRDAYENRRALVLADGFYEWVEADDGRKQPYRVAFEDDRPFAMAGLWERWEPSTTQTGLEAFGGGSQDVENGGEAGPLETFTIITTTTNDLVGDLHHRMAAILERDSEREWLGGEESPSALGPRSDEEMVAYPVSTAVNSPATDDPSLVEPV